MAFEPFTPFGLPSRRSSYPYDEEEEESLLRQISRPVLSGLSVVGNALDLPGSVLRDIVGGVVSGDWDRHNPLDQLLSPFSHEDRTSGRDLLETIGILDRNQSGLDVGDVAGFGAEVLMDPFFFATAPTKALVAAPAKLAGRAAAKTVGKTRLGKAIASGADEALRTGRALFDADVRQARTAHGQKYGRQATADIEAGRASNRRLIGEQLQRLAERDALGEGPARVLRSSLESMDDAPAGPFADIVGDVRGRLDPMIDEKRALGLAASELEDEFARYFPRLSTAETKAGGFDSRAFKTLDQHQQRRADPLRNIEGGTESIRTVMMDPDLNRLIDEGIDPASLAGEIQQRYGRLIPDDNLVPFARKMHALPRESRDVGLFGNHPLADLLSRLDSDTTTKAAARNVYDMLGDVEGLSAARGAYAGSRLEPVTIRETLGKAGLGVTDDTTEALSRLGGPERLDELIPQELANDIVRLMEGYTTPEAANAIVQGFDKVTNLTKSALTSLFPSFHMRNLTSGQFQNWLLKMHDPSSVGQAWKLMTKPSVEGLTDIPAVKQRLAAEGRELTDANASDAVRRMLFEHELVGKFQHESAVLAGQGAPSSQQIHSLFGELPGGLSSQPEGFSFGRVLGKATGRGDDVDLNPLNIRGVRDDMERSTFGPAAAGEDAGYFVEGLNRISPFINQLKKGVDPAEAAMKVKAAQVDYAGRTFTTTERQIMRRLFPFYSFTRKTLPFHVQQLIENPGGRLAQSIRATQTARSDEAVLPNYIAEGAAIPWPSGPAGDPRYLTGLGTMFEDTASLAFTPTAGGIKDIGLELLSRANPLIKGPAEFVTGQSFFQRGPRGGRELEDLDPVWGRLFSNIGRIAEDPSLLVKASAEPGPRDVSYAGDRLWEPLTMNSPISRVLTTARQLTDTRKGPLEKAINLLTGARVSDVPERAQEAILREQAAELLESVPNVRSFTRQWVDDETMAELDATNPARAAQIRNLQEVLKILSERAKRRAKEREAQQAQLLGSF